MGSFGKAVGKLIVGGSSGNLGRLILRELLTTNRVPASQIIALTRTPEKIKDYSDRGVEVRFSDYNRPESLIKAFRGGERFLLICTDSFMKEREEQHKNAIDGAIKAGVKHFLFTSLQTPAKNKNQMKQVQDLFNEEQALERASERHGVSYTLLGFNIWMESILDWYGYSLETGTLLTLPGTGRVAHISRADCARATAAALASDMSTNEKFELSGTQALDLQQMADIVSKTLELKRPIRVKTVTPPELQHHYRTNVPVERRNVADFYAWFMTEFEKCFRDGSLADVHDGYFRLMGHHPENFVSWLYRNKELYKPKFYSPERLKLKL